jgi:hypothetical protein
MYWATNCFFFRELLLNCFETFVLLYRLKNLMKTMCVCLLLLLVYNILLSKEENYYSKGTVILSNYESMEIKNITRYSNYITFLHDNKIDTLSNNEIELLRLKVGNYAGIGTGLGLLMGVLIDLRLTLEGVPFTGIGTGIFGVIGLVSGLFTNKMMTVDILSSPIHGYMPQYDPFQNTKITNHKLFNIQINI